MSKRTAKKPQQNDGCLVHTMYTPLQIHTPSRALDDSSHALFPASRSLLCLRAQQHIVHVLLSSLYTASIMLCYKCSCTWSAAMLSRLPKKEACLPPTDARRAPTSDARRPIPVVCPCVAFTLPARIIDDAHSP
mmetsp:Transcript_30688/g.79716  ORF Transcript_30688/g.79716 Transcript_30688/m.79716 type:complete len:134 (+) Transcript_30688:312-713(+)